MSTKKPYKIRVNKLYEFEENPSFDSNFDVLQTSENQYHTIFNNQSFKSKILENDFLNKTYTVEVNGNKYQVEIADELDQLIKEMGFEVGAGKKVNSVKAPMPGLILEINAQVGQEVQEGDSLLILEAMKMENKIASPRDGIIKSIAVSPKQAIEKGQLLIEFE